jgi:CheY-like chemotaxis protein
LLFALSVFAVDWKWCLHYTFFVEKHLEETERRKHTRALVRASAVLVKGEQSLGSFRVVNASAGGLLLGGAPPGPLGTEIEVILRLGPERSVRARAVVCREQVNREGTGFAVSFLELSAEDQARIEEAVEAYLERVRSVSVLVVDDSREVGQALSLELARLGQAAHAVQTPLEAVCLLEERNQVSVAIIDLVLGNEHGLDLIAYLADRHPKVRRVLMSGHAHPAQLALSRHSAARSAPHEILAKPWNHKTLARAVGL